MESASQGMNASGGGEPVEHMEIVHYDVTESVAERMASITEQQDGEDGSESDTDSDFSGPEDSDIPSAGGTSEDDEEWMISRQKIKTWKRLHMDNEDECAAEQEMTFSDEEYLYDANSSDDEGDGDHAMVQSRVDSDSCLRTLVWKVGMRFSSAEIFKEQVCSMEP